LSEWLRVMLEEISRKKAEAEQAEIEASRRLDEQRHRDTHSHRDEQPHRDEKGRLGAQRSGDETPATDAPKPPG
jgi:hypothetical protein